jgi:signal recognition particle receptor subunit beta
MGGANEYRPMWQQYADGLDGLIFVVDSSDPVRFSTASDELHAILNLPQVTARVFPVLVFANKNDIEGSAPTDVITHELGLSNITNRLTLVKSVCAHFAKDLHTGLSWLVANRTTG